jgi:beta-glucanase (GH16 family)
VAEHLSFLQGHISGRGSVAAAWRGIWPMIWLWRGEAEWPLRGGTADDMAPARGEAMGRNGPGCPSNAEDLGW